MKQSTLRIKPHFSIIPHSAQQVELRCGVWNPTSFIVNAESCTNKLYPILKDLNGSLTVQEVANKHNISRIDVEGILDHLQQLEVLESSTSEIVQHYPDSFVENVPASIGKLENILIIGDDVVSREMKRLLSHSISENCVSTIDINDPEIKDIRTNSQWKSDSFILQETIDKFSWWKDYFIVVALTKNDPILTLRLNQINYALNIPWMHGVMDGPFLFIGPLFNSTSGPCYSCFEKRITMNLHEYASYQKYKEISMIHDIDDAAENKCSPAMHVFLSHLILEIINYRHAKTCFTKGKVLSIYLPTMEICFNEVMRLSGCPVCGSVSNRDDQQLFYDYQTLLENVKYD